MKVIEKIKKGLIVSCQASEEEPLHGSIFMQKMAIAAVEGGAIGIRANGVEDVKAIRSITDLPIIGINKVKTPGSDVYITPKIEDVKKLIEAGAEIVAVDATNRKRADGTLPHEFIQRVKNELDIVLMADVSTFEEGKSAYEAGADLIGSTLSGYTSYTEKKSTPDFELMEELVRLPVPIIAEGKIWTPEEAVKALTIGVHAVVVGTAITRPQEITKRFVDFITINLSK